jgi:hypothetical protein
MSRLFRIQVDTERPIVQELHDFYPEMVDILECMVIDGTEERQDVADYVDAVFSGDGLPVRGSA